MSAKENRLDNADVAVLPANEARPNLVFRKEIAAVDVLSEFISTLYKTNLEVALHVHIQIAAYLAVVVGIYVPSHFVLAVQNVLGSLRVVEDPADKSALSKAEDEEEKPTGMSADELEEAESEFDKFIDISAPRQATATDADGDGSLDIDSSTADLTGRNFAAKTFDKIEQNIADSFSILANPKDEDMFTDYLLTNLKLYFDKYEDELKGVVSEPSTEEYEDEKAEMDAEDTSDELGGESDPEPAGDLGDEEEDDGIDINL